MASWFDQHAAAQKSAGPTDPRVFHSSDDKNEVVILFNTDDTKRVASPDLSFPKIPSGLDSHLKAESSHH
jgi:hypothetical protein